MDGVLNGLKFAGDKLVFRQVLVEQVQSIYEGLGAVGVRYLKVRIDVHFSRISCDVSVTDHQLYFDYNSRY